MVGVGFYAGVEITAPDVVSLADAYYSKNKLMDFKIVSTLGLTEDDVAALSDLEGVKSATGSYSLDVQSTDRVIRVHAIEGGVNRLSLTEGRMPKALDECVADSKTNSIGDVIEITDDVSDELKNTKFKVVGLADSCLYLQDEYGNTSVGNGKLGSFIFVNKNNFTLDAYTEVYLLADTTAQPYSTQYNDFSAKLKDEIVLIKAARETARYEGVYNEAMDKIVDAQDELDTKMADAEKEFADAKKELDDNAKKLKDTKSSTQKQLSSAKSTLDDSKAKLEAGKSELSQNKEKLEETKSTKSAEFEAAKAEIESAKKQLGTYLSAAGVTSENIGSKVSALEGAIESMKAQLQNIPAGTQEYLSLEATINAYSENLTQLKRLESSLNELSANEKQLNDGIATFNSEIQKAEAEIKAAENEIAANEAKINNGYNDYYANLSKFNTEIAKNEKKLKDGYAEYEENYAEYEAEIADAKAEIEEAKVDVSEIERPKWYISDRDAAAGYSNLESSVRVVNVISAVLPVFFILLSILMTSNSMARMIAEERGELGTLTSLGYGDFKIMSTYLMYVLSATGLGALTGFFGGCKLIPPLVYSNFRFILPSLIMKYDFIRLAIIIAFTFALMSAVTIIACHRELKHNPASLLRPLPPKRGQAVFLEKIKLVWKKLSFTWKVTVRNMLRYKKRAFMTVVGVAGCAALLIVGFGLRDSMEGVAKRQYSEIFKYSDMLILKDETSVINGELKEVLDENNITNPLLVRQNTYTVVSGKSAKKTQDAYLIVPQDDAVFKEYFNLINKKTGEEIDLKDGEAVITQRLAKVLKVKAGDSIVVTDNENESHKMTVAAVAENYASNYIYLQPDVYERIFAQKPSYNAVISGNETVDEAKLAENLIDSGLITNVVFTSDAIQIITESTNSLNGVIILIIFVALLLAVVVLYNLTSINISERIREIATLKVLGFRDNETNSYIYREALILTVISIGAGIGLGLFLHNFLLDAIEVGALALIRSIKWYSYIIACALTLLFSVGMQGITYLKLKKIDMIQSLKSVE
jgi:putative ABC transport system permease protein